MRVRVPPPAPCFALRATHGKAAFQEQHHLAVFFPFPPSACDSHTSSARRALYYPLTSPTYLAYIQKTGFMIHIHHDMYTFGLFFEHEAWRFQPFTRFRLILKRHAHIKRGRAH